MKKFKVERDGDYVVVTNTRTSASRRHAERDFISGYHGYEWTDKNYPQYVFNAVYAIYN